MSLCFFVLRCEEKFISRGDRFIGNVPVPSNCTHTSNRTIVLILIVILLVVIINTAALVVFIGFRFGRIYFPNRGQTNNDLLFDELRDDAVYQPSIL